MSKIFKPFIKFFALIYKIIDKIIVTPISRLVFNIDGIFKDNSGKIEKILNRPNVLIYISLFLAICVFVLVDTKVINLTEREAEIISDQPVNVVYNEEAYIVEGVPETVDITLIGSQSNIYLATQLSNHEVTLDLSNYGVGTYKVKLKYNHSIQSVDYKLDPSTVTIKISEKVSEVKNLTYDLLNEDKIDQKLSVSKVTLDTNEIIVKSSQENLDKIATVKALVDVSSIDSSTGGEYKIDSVTLVAYDEEGEKLDNIEMVPSKVSAVVTVDSYHAKKTVKVVTSGSMTKGYAISSITSSVKEVDVYGDKETVDALNNIEAVVDISNITADKTVSVTLTKPASVRYISETNTSVTIGVGTATQKTITGVAVHTTGLADNLTANAVGESDKSITVIITGVESVLNEIDASSIYAYVDLSGLSSGTHKVKVKYTLEDERVKIVDASLNTEVNVKILQK